MCIEYGIKFASMPAWRHIAVQSLIVKRWVQLIGISLMFGAHGNAKDRVPLYVDCFELQEVRDATAVIKI